MQYCQKCGKPNEIDAVFCNKCGKPIGAVAQVELPEPEVEVNRTPKRAQRKKSREDKSIVIHAKDTEIEEDDETEGVSLQFVPEIKQLELEELDGTTVEKVSLDVLLAEGKKSQQK